MRNQCSFKKKNKNRLKKTLENVKNPQNGRNNKNTQTLNT